MLTPEKYTEVALLYNKGTTYLEKENYKKAFQYLKKSLDLHTFKEGYVNIGNCYRAQGLHKKAEESYLVAIRENVPYLQEPANIKQDTMQHAYNNLGLARYTVGDDIGALRYYELALKRDPEFYEAMWNYSTCVLRQASSGPEYDEELFREGWFAYDSRFLKSPPVKLKNRREGLLYWDRKCSGSSIVILAEQGIGDLIMFGRYIPWLYDKFSHVYLQCDEGMEVLFSDMVDGCIRDAAELESVDWAVPICSLASAFAGVGCIPSGDYLAGKFDRRNFEEGFNVGIAWAGSPSHANNAYRSVPIGRFHGLAKYCNLYSLSPGFSGTKFVKSLDIRSWRDTAEAINGLDLVISVDTSVIHLCGALGRPGWVLQPMKETDFRWGNGVRRSLWYDSIEVYENPCDWEYVFEAVERDLRELVYA